MDRDDWIPPTWMIGIANHWGRGFDWRRQKRSLIYGDSMEMFAQVVTAEFVKAIEQPWRNGGQRNRITRGLGCFTTRRHGCSQDNFDNRQAIDYFAVAASSLPLETS